MKKATFISISVLAGTLLLAGGAALGYSTGATQAQSAAATSPNPMPCNLRLVWDRAAQDYLAVYEDSAMISYTPKYGRIANPSCTDAEILAWQDYRRADRLDAAVCRPVLRDEATGLVSPIGCAVPTMVVSDEPR
ncbi:hypothetical protein [Microbacterium resistens]|uniref:hypothetical protein n=1 Tax=Microbacterium resistens TaxID=156977 RepID=UPI0008304B32|nr:hypothetical protein [Microbacterium resistens]